MKNSTRHSLTPDSIEVNFISTIKGSTSIKICLYNCNFCFSSIFFTFFDPTLSLDFDFKP